jgi:NAD(P)-dependent dehydrogenase (short-subunit alcohol dehydrogenase family)
VRALVNRTLDVFGTIGILVNNAGVKLMEAVDDADLANWRRMVEVNLLDAMNMTREAPPSLKNNGATGPMYRRSGVDERANTGPGTRPRSSASPDSRKRSNRR